MVSVRKEARQQNKGFEGAAWRVPYKNQRLGFTSREGAFPSTAFERAEGLRAECDLASVLRFGVAARGADSETPR